MTVLDFSASNLPGQIQANMIAYMRLFAGLPGMVMGETEQIFWFVSKKPGPGHGIFQTRWHEGNVEEHIDVLLAEIGQHIDEIEWQVYPGDEPADLGKRLEARGMPGGPGGNWLWASLAKLPSPPPAPDGFRVEQVKDHTMMEKWLRVSLAGFAGQEVASFKEAYAEMSSFYDAYARHGFGPDAFSLHYLGYLGDLPVTSGTLLDAGGTAAIYDVSTPPTYRRQGLGGAITHAMMAEIRRRGYPATWIWSSDSAKSVYQKLGYEEADFGVRAYRWRAEKP
jgi:GNAT superfamily N-acetyltransferase